MMVKFLIIHILHILYYNIHHYLSIILSIYSSLSTSINQYYMYNLLLMSSIINNLKSYMKMLVPILYIPTNNLLFLHNIVLHNYISRLHLPSPLNSLSIQLLFKIFQIHLYLNPPLRTITNHSSILTSQILYIF